MGDARFFAPSGPHVLADIVSVAAGTAPAIERMFRARRTVLEEFRVATDPKASDVGDQLALWSITTIGIAGTSDPEFDPTFRHWRSALAGQDVR